MSDFATCLAPLIYGGATAWRIEIDFGKFKDVANLISCANVSVDRLRGFLEFDVVELEGLHRRTS